MLKEFKAFIMRGNVVDLAVGVIIGAAFTAVINSLVKNVFTPIIGVVGGTGLLRPDHHAAARRPTGRVALRTVHH